MERLEQRYCLAGNVTAALNGSEASATLKITGDAEANTVGIRFSSGQLEVFGAETTINGQVGIGVQTSAWAGGTLTIDMKGGNDIVGIVGIDGIDGIVNPLMLKALTVNLGTGEDRLVIGSVQVTGNGETKLTLGSDAETDLDEARILGSTFAGNVTVLTGGGNDIVGLFDSSSVAKKLTINSGPQDDRIEFGNANGSPKVQTLSLLTGAGNDVVDIRDFQVTSTTVGSTIDTGAGDDQVELGRNGLSDFKNALTLKLGDGANTLKTFNGGLSVAKGLTITGGKGNDTLQLDGAVTAASLTATLGDGTNSLTASAGVTAITSVTINGGKNDDNVQLNGGVLTKTLTAKLADGNDTFVGNNIADVLDFETNPAAKGTVLNVDLGKGDDSATVTNVFGNNVTVHLGAGTNTFALDNMNALKFILNGGADNDTATVATLTAGQFLVNLFNGNNILNVPAPFMTKLDYKGGPGTDPVSLTVGGGGVSLIDQLFANLGAGDDSLEVTNFNVPQIFKIDGGDGTDTLINSGATAPPAATCPSKTLKPERRARGVRPGPVVAGLLTEPLRFDRRSPSVSFVASYYLQLQSWLANGRPPVGPKCLGQETGHNSHVRSMGVFFTNVMVDCEPIRFRISHR